VSPDPAAPAPDTSAVVRRRNFDEARRLAIAYTALFLVAGIHLPFWPVWLEHRGVGPEEMGVLLGLGNWARLTTPWIGAWADRSGRGPQLLVVVACAVLATLVAFQFAHAFALLVILSVLLGIAYAPIIPLLDGMAIGATAAGRMDYGRVRLWGSVSFIAASVIGGRVLEGRHASLVLYALQGAAVLLVLATIWLRRMPTMPKPDEPQQVAWSGVLRRPRFATFLICVAFLQAGHAVLYGFGTKHWIANDIAESTIGWYWGVGVLAEVVLFVYGAKVIARIGAPGLLVLAGIGAVVRWTALGLTTDVAATFAIQILHALTFGAMHLGAMSWIRENIAGPAVHRATSLYVAVAAGMALGIGMPLAGVLFEHFHGDAYYAMTALGLIGTVFAWRLVR
jgi:PPP family 3-phenylpropionic acid transporter